MSVTSAAIFVKRTTHAGLVIWQTRMSPSRTSSNSSTVRTTRAVPSTTPGDPEIPVIRPVSAAWPRWNFSGKPQLARYGKASWVSVAVPTQLRCLVA